MNRIIISLILIFILSISCVSCDSEYNRNAHDSNQSSFDELPTSFDASNQQEDSDRLYYIPISITEKYNGKTYSSIITLDSNNLPANITYGKENIPTRDYTYDANGNVIKLVCTYADGGKTITDYTYDENGHVIKYIYTKFDGSKETTDRCYDSNGNLIKSIVTLPSGARQIFDRIYDANGHIVKESHEYSDGDKIVTDYIYDGNGKLIKKIFTDFDVCTSCSIRKCKCRLSTKILDRRFLYH